MPLTFEKAGVVFAYPDNWTVEEDEDPGAAELVVTAFSPETAFWTVTRFDGYLDVRELARDVLEALQAEYPQTEVDEVDDEFDGVSTIGYEVSFVYLDLVNTATITTFHHADSTFLVLSQAEDGELATVDPIFDAMLISMLRSTKSD